MSTTTLTKYQLEGIFLAILKSKKQITVLKKTLLAFLNNKI